MEMDYMKLLEIMVKVQMDDLADSEMLLDYAKEAIEYGSDDIANKLVNRSKTRMQNYDNCTAEIETLVSRMKDENPEVNEKAIMYDVQKFYISDWKNKIKEKLSVM